MKKLVKAREYRIETLNKWKNKFHAEPPFGWMNDPNGFVFFNGKIHLFYQFYPYAPRWGTMHWGHMVSEDFIKWEHLPVALAPDKRYDNFLGCFSGSAIEKDGKLFLLYTGVSMLGGQQQCLAVSDDGIEFVKFEKPVISRTKRPSGTDFFNFRDPKVFLRDEIYYCVAGSAARTKTDKKTVKGRMVAVYSSKNLYDWRYMGAAFADFKVHSGIFECPDLFGLDGFDVLIASSMNFYPPQEEYRFNNVQSSVYLVGKFDCGSGKFTPETDYAEIDSGFDFYAPQTMLMPDGRRIMIAWKQMWKRSMPEAAAGRAGSMTFPRELSLKGKTLVQKPAKEILSYRGEAVSYKDVRVCGAMTLKNIQGVCADIEMSVDISKAEKFEILLFKGNENETVISFDNGGVCVFDRRKSGEKIVSYIEAEANIRKARFKNNDGKLDLRILMDVASCELFVNDFTAMTANVFPPENSDGIEFRSEGESVIKSIDFYPLKV